MDLIEKHVGDVIVVELKGDVLGGPDATKISTRIRELIKDQKKNLVLDLQGVDYMNSSGLGMLTAAHTLLKKEGGTLKLARPATRIQSLLSITKLNTLIDAYGTVDDAVASF
ncbi:anti-sigma-factor antagonist [Chloroherpeton thalassium ATCC 35110]|uniref:Anti-sigma factor antagonist n=1 Tax=Chloroherpeton thalassium (strain ATCC 35110 / GB-78) TaxID=517418 RepID=B3QTH5_CHLT3|nr:STAS domain-containing protein [Chloroherpeton thalassium]ACF12721.1 anti-sigma-factor antagonist [Chloroherpeton thalassium ATCC 35110]